MAHTFRDGAYSPMFYDSAGVCFSSALGKKFAKKVSRKRQRRQLHAIEKQAVQEFYIDRTLELLEEALRYSNDFYEYLSGVPRTIAMTGCMNQPKNCTIRGLKSGLGKNNPTKTGMTI